MGVACSTGPTRNVNTDVRPEQQRTSSITSSRKEEGGGGGSGTFERKASSSMTDERSLPPRRITSNEQLRMASSNSTNNAYVIQKHDLNSTVRKMHDGEALSKSELDAVQEILRCGPSYVQKVRTTVKGMRPLTLTDNVADGNEESIQHDPLENTNNSSTAPAWMKNIPSNGSASENPRNVQTDSLANSTLSREAVSEHIHDLVDGNDPASIRRIQEGNLLVQHTWAEALTTPDFALCVLNRLWELDSNLAESLFFRTNRRDQAQRLGAMLNKAILLLDKPDAFMPVMMQLGVRHIMYGVGDVHMDVFGGLLVTHLQETLQPPLTPWSDSLAKEWKRAFGLMKALMAQGRSTPQGIRDSKRYDTQTHRITLRCWKSVVDRESTGLETSFVELLYNRVLEKKGEVGFGTQFSTFVAHRRMFMDMMTKLFELGLADPESQHVLHELGARHLSYGLTKEIYDAFADPFIATVVECSRPSTMTPQIYQLMKGFWIECGRLMVEGAVQSRCGFSLRLAPKSSPFAIVFTDIEGSTALWETQSVAMEKAVDEHHKLMRDLIHDHNGYEVKTVGDSFMVAFKSLAEAVKMSLRVQTELLRASVEGLSIDGTRCEASGPDNVWNPSAVRVRVGVHWCTDAAPKFDVVYKRYDYYGNDVNAASRVQDAACGGQVLCTSATLKALKAMEGAVEEECMKCGKLTSLYPDPKSTAKASLKDVLGTSLYMENAELKGLQDSVTLHSLYPKVLEGRVFGKRKKDVFVE